MATALHLQVNGSTVTSGERRFLTSLSAGLGFSQGCGLCFYVASGGYFGDVFSDKHFFVDACAVFYLPPILVTLAQLLLDQRFDALLGVRPVINFRVYVSSLAVALCLALLAAVVGSPAYRGEGKLVYSLGAVLGIFAACLLGSSCVLFGAVDPRNVPFFVLGQTAAGVFTNIVARALGFGPGCDVWRARAFFGVAAGTVLSVTLAFYLFSRCKYLESTYRRHEELLSLSLSSSSLEPGPAREECQPSGSTTTGFPLICWSMAACQAMAIAMNMSLTPLATQIAHGGFDLTQELVLVKLAADFIGRTLFLFIPKPRSDLALSPGRDLCGVRTQAALVWTLELLRAPFWLSVYLWALRSPLPLFLSDPRVLLWAVWLPLISTGALSSSWCFVIAATAAPEDRKRAVNLLMSSSVYVGFASGIVIALLST